MNTLFDVDEVPHELTPQERFDLFHKMNPRVYEELERMTAELALRGRRRIGIKMLFEVLRYNFYLTTNDPESPFKLNNNFTAFYSRLLVENHPDWEDMFEFRFMQDTQILDPNRRQHN